MAIAELLLIFTLASLAGFLILRATEAKRKQRQLQEAFYQLLEAQNSCISLIQLAAAARVNSRMAQQYLEEQIKTFSAVPEVDADGDMFYRFPKVYRRLNKQESEW